MAYEMPLLFKHIVENDAHRSEIYARAIWPLFILNDLNVRRRELTMAAEIALSWNTNKGAQD